MARKKPVDPTHIVDTTTPAWQAVLEAVLRRARGHGSVTASDIREELTRGGIPEDYWQTVVDLTRPTLQHRDGRYHFVPSLSQRLKQEQRQQRHIQRTVRRLIRHYRRAADRVERREEGRFEFILPVTIRTEDQRELHVLTRDLSPTGIRLIGTRGLLGQKVRVEIPDSAGSEPASFLVRILWTCSVGDDLFENGGRFLEVTEERG
jgi:hypothetical protein